MPAYNPEIKWAFNQFENAFIGLAAYLETRLKKIIPTIPVFFLQTGDFSYMVNKKFVETKNEEVIMKVPRFVMKIDDIQPNQTENTNQYNKIFYRFDGGVYQCVVRRLCYLVTLQLNFVSSNFITMLNHMEIMSTFAAHDNVFTYEFLGNTHQAALSLTSSNHELPSIDMGQGGTRNISVNSSGELQVHILSPRLETITKLDDVGFDQIMYDIHTDDGSVDTILDPLKNRQQEPTPHIRYNNGYDLRNFPK